MTAIPRSVLDYASGQVNALSADAQARVLKVLESISWTPENISACRDLVLEALRSVLPGYTSMSAQAGADMYDAVREHSTGAPLGAQAISGYVQDAVDGAVRAFVQDIVDGKPVEQFNEKVLDRVDYEIRRSANVCAAVNAERDPLKPRYARVPSGGETCGFCLMLASRGFVYTSEDAAGHAHANCDCRIVPGFEGLKVEGYDPSALYSDYLDGKFGTFESKRGSGRHGGRRMAADSGRGFASVGDMSRYLSEAPDLESLYARCYEVQQALGRFFSDRKRRDSYLADLRRAASRRHGELVHSDGSGIVTYTKPRSELEPHEAAGIDLLSARGFDLETIPEIGSAPANLDIVMEGEEWEMKNVTNSGSSTGNQIGRIREKFWKIGRPGEARGVITTVGCSDPFESVVSEVGARGGYAEMIVIGEGEMKRIRKEAVS